MIFSELYLTDRDVTKVIIHVVQYTNEKRKDIQ